MPVIIPNPHITLSEPFQERHTKHTHRKMAGAACDSREASLAKLTLCVLEEVNTGKTVYPPTVKVKSLSDTSNEKLRMNQ